MIPNVIKPIVILGAILCIPLIMPAFFVSQIGSQGIIYGLIALGTMILAGYGGMISLAQITIAGSAAYTVAILGENSTSIHGYGLSYWIVVPIALAVAVAFSTLIGAAAVRTKGVYTIMITLAVAAAFFYFTMQNYAVFNGFSGYAGVRAPAWIGASSGRKFYYICAAIAVLSYCCVVYVADTPFGLSAQAFRDNEERARAVGFNVVTHKLALNAFAGLFSGLGGILLVWFNGRSSPGSISVDVAIDVLVIAIVGGIRHPVGAFVGAILFLLLKTYAIDLVGAERFNSLIALVFLTIVFASPDGLLGLWRRVRHAAH